MSNFMTQAFLTYKGLFMWLNPPGYISNVFVTPILYIIMFTLTGRFAGNPEAAEGYIIGLAGYAIPAIINGGIGQSFSYERMFGTLAFLYGSAANRLLNYFSRGVFHYLNGIIVATFALFMAWAVIDLELADADWLALGCSVIAIAVACTCFALFMGNIALVFRDWIIVSTATNGLLISMTGVVIPREELPGLLGEVGHVLPLTHGLVAFREAIAGAGLGSVWENLLLELAVALGYAVAGYLAFRAIEVQAKRSGAYESTF